MSTDRCLKALIRDPLGPLTLMVLALTEASTPSGTATVITFIRTR